MDTTDLNNEPKKTKIALDSDLVTTRLFPFIRVDIYSVGAGDENRTRVLNLGGGCTRDGRALRKFQSLNVANVPKTDPASRCCFRVADSESRETQFAFEDREAREVPRDLSHDQRTAWRR